MTTSISIPFTADSGKLVIDGSRQFGPPTEIATDDFKGREPIAWAAAREFLDNAATSGTISISAA